ncbi:hypothetical protein RB597_002890 [Gaeumannomyces tritici]
MDRQKLAALLQESQVPDTEKVKAITAELQKNYFPHPESLLALLEIVCVHSDVGVRQQASVQASRLVVKHWPSQTAKDKEDVRKHLVEAVMKEQNAKCRHSISRLISNIASIDFADGEWKELFQGIFQLAESDNVGQREVGSYLIYATLESDPTHFSEHLAHLFTALQKLMQDPQSLEVRVNAVMSVGCGLLLVDTDDEEDADKVALIQSLVPHIADVLRAAVQAADDEKIKQTFETLQQFLAYDSSLLGKYLKDLMQFTIEIAANPQADDEARSQSLSFLTQAVRYRRMKLMAMGDLIKVLVEKCLQILTELDDDDDEDETTPARASLALLSQLSSDLPPRHVIVPLLDQFAAFSSSPQASHRKAGVLALGICAEGAPDFVNTQMKSILPIVIGLLNDQDVEVRHAALIGLTRLAEEMSEDVAAEHEALVGALLKNLQAAVTENTDDKSKKKNTAVIRSVCAAFDAMCDGVKPEVMHKYGPQLLDPIGSLLVHEDARVKIAAAGALGAIATSMADEFKPYFAKIMTALAPYMAAKETEEDLTLRSGICDAIGRIAVAVGSEAFQPYVDDLMRNSEEGLHLDSSELRESSFILWSQLCKVYEKDFAPYLDGVFKALLDSLNEDDDDVALNLTEEELAIAGDALELVTAGKRAKVRAADADETLMDDDDEDDEDFEDFMESAEAMEKEVAIEVLGDIIYHSCGTNEISKYLEKALEAVTPLLDHHYEGCRKSAISTLWRSYARVWQLSEEETGVKWEAGFPPKQTPSVALIKLGEIVTKGTLSMWAEESERDVVTEINRMVAHTLRVTGPAVLVGEETLTQVISALTLIVTRSHACQQDLGNEIEDQDVQESSEYDWLVIDTALDVVISLSVALGPSFGELWKIFEKPVMKFASSNDALERSTAVGVIAECINYMGTTCTPYTSPLLKLLLHRLSDEDPETKSNAAYGAGQLVLNSTDSKTYLPSFDTILSKIEPMLNIPAPTSGRILDNACGCLCRLIMAHPDRVNLDEYLPVLVDRLPLKEDFEENTPIFQCIFKLYEHDNQTVSNLTPKLIPVFEKVLSPPEDQLTAETRELVKKIVQILYKAKPDLFQAHQAVVGLAA